MTDWLGNLPTWVSAIASSLALVCTSWTAWNSQRNATAAATQAKIALDAQEERNEKDKSDQASKVAAWIEHRGDSYGSKLYVYYLNASNLPIFDLCCRLTVLQRAHTLEVVAVPSNEVKEFEYLSATEWLKTYFYSLFSEVLSELSMADFEHNEEVGNEIEEIKGKHFEALSRLIAHRGVEVQFTDLSGAQWCRNSDGNLCDHAFPAELPYPDRWEWFVNMVKSDIKEDLQSMHIESQNPEPIESGRVSHHPVEISAWRHEPTPERPKR